MQETINIKGLEITKESIEKVAEEAIPTLQEYIEEYELTEEEKCWDQLASIIHEREIVAKVMYGVTDTIIDIIFEKMGIKE